MSKETEKKNPQMSCFDANKIATVERRGLDGDLNERVFTYKGSDRKFKIQRRIEGWRIVIDLFEIKSDGRQVMYIYNGDDMMLNWAQVMGFWMELENIEFKNNSDQTDYDRADLRKFFENI